MAGRKDNEAGKAKAGSKSAQDGKSSKKPKAQPVSKSVKAGLVFPVGRVLRYLKRRTTSHVRFSATSAVFAAAILEYLTAEVVELAGNISQRMNLKRIGPRQLQLAIRGDDELDRLVQAIIPGGGVIPHIHKCLIAKKKKEDNKSSKN